MQNKKIIRLMQNGFSMIELLIVLAILGVIAALALPSYFNYLSQSQVARVYGELAATKMATDAALFSGRKPVSTASITGTSEEYIGYNAQISNLISAFDIDFRSMTPNQFSNVALVATLGDGANVDIKGSVLVLSKNFDSETKIVDQAGWRCKYFKGGPSGTASGWNVKFTPAGCTAVNGVYVP